MVKSAPGRAAHWRPVKAEPASLPKSPPFHLISQRAASCTDRPLPLTSMPPPQELIICHPHTTGPALKRTPQHPVPVRCGRCTLQPQRTANKEGRAASVSAGGRSRLICPLTRQLCKYLLGARHTLPGSQWSHLFIESTIHVCSIDGRVECEVFPVFTLEFFKFAVSWGTVPFKHKITMLVIVTQNDAHKPMFEYLVPSW